MSKNSRERRERNKAVQPDAYFTNGIFELAHFGKNTIVRNNRPPKQHTARMEYLCMEYPSRYESITQKIRAIKDKATWERPKFCVTVQSSANRAKI